MARYNIVGPSYKSQSVNADGQVSMNWYMERLEREGGKAQFALYPTPGLEDLYALGSSGVRGMITANGRSFAVAGTKLFELKANGSAVERGTLISDGLPISITSGVFQLLIASAGSAYVFDLNANSFAIIPSPTIDRVLQVGYISGFFIALVINSAGRAQIFASDVNDATAWDPASETIPNVFTDNANSIFVDHNELWVGGPKAIQVFGLDGGVPFPLSPISGAFIEHGVGAADSFAKADNSIFWLEADERGNGIVRRAQGYVPARVSDHALEYEIQNYSRIDDAIGTSFQINGHEIYQLTFPTAEKTKRLDTATGLWHDAGFWNTQAGRYTRHRAQFHTFNFGKHLVGDPTTGAVYRMSDSVCKDFGNPIRRRRVGPHICDEQKRLFVSRVQIDIEAGVGPVPPLQGNEDATVFTLADPTGILWGLSMGDTGILGTNPQGFQQETLFLNDPIAGSSWQITIDALGVLHPVAVAYNSAYPPTLEMVAQSGNARWTLSAEQLGAGIARLVTEMIGPITRGPEIMLRWSRDGGHTFGNESVRDFGEAGEYAKRVIWNRQGSGRDLVPEIVITDPVPARIIEAYAEIS